ncbi:hypothetical protein LSG23_09345 [Bacillus velezensis]|uniref:hypothetical protein n=1 Tax=Bacillus velezensis TaxID=492670 RepID=UPI000987FA66|nr:hypothetical protein [Bacillus velezensis]AQS44183.1 hypothetical protein BVH55_09795 [Bacillus velezensis]WNR79429.1 hypothetical protein RP314_10990 [Bacillus velezensis]
MKYDKDRIKESLTLEDIHKILKELGSENNQWDQQGNPIYRTVCHNASGGSYKLYYYHEAKQFHCYTECGDTFDVFELVIRAKSQKGINISFNQAIEYVARLAGRTFGFGNRETFTNNDLIDDWEWMGKFKKRKKIDIELPSFNETVLDVFMPYPHQMWLDEGISMQTLNDFEIGYYFRTHTEGITIPHRDLNNRLIGIRRRSLIKEEVDAGYKYMPLKIGNTLYNHQTMMNLYGLHKTKDSIERFKKVLIFESEKSVLKCQDFYGEANFTCAVCSNNISNFHRDILLSLGVEEVFIALDKYRPPKDHETEEMYQRKLLEYQKKILKLAAKFTPYVRVYVLWDFENILDYKDSPADKGKDVLEELMRRKIEINTNEGGI